MNAVIIGSGVAGMATAARLASCGYNVTVLEANQTYGGKLGFLKLGDYSFDTGPSLFTQPQLLEQLFSDCGKDLNTYLNYTKLDISCKYVFEQNGTYTTLNAYTDQQKFDAELVAQHNEKPGALIAYLKKSSKLYHKIGSIFLNYSLHKLSTWLQAHIVPALAAVKLPYLFSTLHQWNSKHFQNAKTVQLFDRFATYNGSNPYATPAMMSMIPYLELGIGTFYPKGGMRKIADALYQLCCDLGVQFNFNTKAEKILTEHKKVIGVQTQHACLMADVVVSNCDIYFTYKNLLNNNLLASRVLKQERSSSGIIFYWGIKKQFEQLHLHNIIFGNDYVREFQNLFHDKAVTDNTPTIYINITSTLESQHASQHGANWFVLVNAPSTDNIDWQQAISTTRQLVIKRMSDYLQQDIEALIEEEQILDPQKIQTNTASYLGALYGTASNNKYASFLRQANFSSHYKGLYFCGGSVHPGGGIPLCLASAQITADLIKKSE